MGAVIGFVPREEYTKAKAPEWASVGAAYREARKGLNLTIQKVATEIGVSSSTLARFEKGVPVRASRLIENAYGLYLVVHNATRRGLLDHMDLDMAAFLKARLIVDCDLSEDGAPVSITRPDGTVVAKVDTGSVETNYEVAEEMCKKLGEPFYCTY
ncbi:helix-turn-helix domain-containing protein [Paenibacillus caui]|uniref:helix-turn-helix domain-containing protein n=1 Tax=Paenibacillus caui TaxID=2873927 RepID=UPI001CA7DE13|nr:helix-turn-helix transcriptional regulator [Paenibacillus caui]